MLSGRANTYDNDYSTNRSMLRTILKMVSLRFHGLRKGTGNSNTEVCTVLTGTQCYTVLLNGTGLEVAGTSLQLCLAI